MTGDFLRPGDPPPVEVLNAGATSGIVICCDHAGRALPTELRSSGLSQTDLARHIAWDIGARDIAGQLALRLNAVAVCGTYSRLVVDLNRYPWETAAMPEVSDGTRIPFNQALDNAQRHIRIEAIHRPYHAVIEKEIARGKNLGCAPALISVHTMTDQLNGGALRSESYAVLWSDRDAELSLAMLKWLRAQGGDVVGDNTPYSLEEGIDFSVPEHAFRHGIPSFMFELRQDLVASLQAARKRADVIAEGLLTCLPAVMSSGRPGPNA